MTARRLPGWAAVLAGVAVTVGTFVVLAAIGLGIGWLALSGAAQAHQALAALLVLGVAAVLACAAGGWAATRLARFPTGAGPRRGLVAGVLALLLVLGLGYAFLRDVVDFNSVAVALGIVDVGGGRADLPVPVPSPVTGSARPSEPTEIARARTLDSVGYAAALLVLLVAAAALGGLAGQGDPSVASGHRRRTSAPSLDDG